MDEALAHALGPAVARALADPDVLEIILNPDGRIWVDTARGGRTPTGVSLGSADAERALRLLAHAAGRVIGPASPRISGLLPGGRERFQGALPPVVAAPTLAIRKRAGRLFTLDDYVATGGLRVEERALIAAQLHARRNILVAGGAGSGKTTLVNALLAEPAVLADRLVLLEDTPELQCDAADHLRMVTVVDPPVTMGDLVRDTLRLRPDRIIVGEVRDGSAYDLLKAWNTGHPGGIATLHANGPQDALHRLEDLAAEATSASVRGLIARTVGCVLFIRRTAEGRVIAPLLDVRGLVRGEYLLARPGAPESSGITADLHRNEYLD